jgi:membrane associated rhomboid family serine protease
MINIAVFGLQLVSDYAAPGLLDSIFALSGHGLSQGYYWQFFTYMFLHGGVIHLLVNCLGLYFAGREVEIVCGPKHLLGMYFLGGFFGGIVQLLVGSPATELVGASAGVCAVLLAFTTILPELEITAFLFFVIPIKMRAKWLGRAVIITSILFYLIGFGRDIGHIAHLGGALTGWIYARRLGYGGAFWLQRLFRDRRRLQERRDRMNPTEFISEEIDPILEKISREGIHSLTRAERRVLELGREKIENKTGRSPLY